MLLALFIRTFIVQAFKIPSGSMIPTLQIGDHILVNKLSYGVRIPFLEKYLVEYPKPERGDVVVFIFPEDNSKDFIKRVIGVAGDTVEVRDKKVYINGKAVDDPHAHFEGYDPQAGGTGSGDDYGPEDGSGKPYLCHGRQSRPQLRQPVLGLCQSRRRARQSVLDLLVLGRQRPLGALGASRQPDPLN